MEENVKNLWLSKIKSGKVAVIESHYAPNNTNCIWLKDGQMYVYGNTGWESLGTGGGGGLIKLPVKFDTIEVIGGGDDPQDPILNSVNPTRGDTKGPGSTTYYCKQKVSGDLFGPTKNGIVLDLAYYFGGGGNPKGGDLRATKSDLLDDVSHRYFNLQEGSLALMKDSQMMLTRLGLDDDSSAKVLVYWPTIASNEDQGPQVLSLIYKGSNYLYVVDLANAGLPYYYNNPDFRGITIMEAEEAPGPGPQ